PTLKSMVLLPVVWFAWATQYRRSPELPDPVPVSVRLVTWNSAGARRSSSASRVSRGRAGALRTGRAEGRANSLRTQERLRSGTLLPGRGGLRYQARAARRARRPSARALGGLRVAPRRPHGGALSRRGPCRTRGLVSGPWQDRRLFVTTGFRKTARRWGLPGT